MTDQLEKYKLMNCFNEKQLKQLAYAIEFGIDPERIANPLLEAPKMRIIVNGLRHRLDVSYYADPKYSLEQMEMIKGALEDELDVTQFTDPALTIDELDDIYDRLIAEQDEQMAQYLKKMNL